MPKQVKNMTTTENQSLTKPKLPKTIKIGPIKIKFNRNKKDLHSERTLNEEPNAIAFTRLFKQDILIDSCLSDDYEAETSLHEVLHAMIELSGVKNKIGYKLEERIVSSISPYLLMIIRDNPAYIEYLQSGS